MNSAIINGMLNYAKLSPKNKEAAINIAVNGMNYIRETCLKTFHWEGEFEDAPISVQYSNMAHFDSSTGYHRCFQMYA